MSALFRDRRGGGRGGGKGRGEGGERGEDGQGHQGEGLRALREGKKEGQRS